MEQYIQILHDMNDLFTEMIPLEKSKMNCVTTRNLSLLEDIMKKEQAGIMRMRGLEQKRMKLQEQLGYGTKTFRDIISSAPEEYTGQLKELYEQLNKTVTSFKSVNESSSQLLELSLHNIDQQIAQLKTAHHMDPDDDLSYDPKDSSHIKKLSFHSRTV